MSPEFSRPLPIRIGFTGALARLRPEFRAVLAGFFPVPAIFVRREGARLSIGEGHAGLGWMK
ncbi:hypothetical protein N7533_004900 [Penicillium manginii]|uniref:uncharacterized protein n=1 Tax=Penicillium manginii TaxID=203109 RepID=UPI002547B50C|nr:uncharacterized protein N7533_004900 [Penicillium manginii]KAJ5755357.1 hypothetical protein N7533_004900 [Penicillium manginii]